MTLLCKKITVTKSKEVKNRCNMVESSKGGYGSKRAVTTTTTRLSYSPTKRSNGFNVRCRNAGRLNLRKGILNTSKAVTLQGLFNMPIPLLII
jgi:hypothetical protein